MTPEEAVRNERRIALIMQDELSPAEREELAGLQAWVGELLAQIAPLPRIADDVELCAALARLGIDPTQLR